MTKKLSKLFCFAFMLFACKAPSSNINIQHKNENNNLHKSKKISDSNSYALVPSGYFTIGSPFDEIGRSNDEVQNNLYVESFYLKKSEVTQKEWMEFSMLNPSKFKKCGDDCPVEQINWYEGLEYMNWLSEKHSLEACYVMNKCTGIIGGGCPPNSKDAFGCNGDYICKDVRWIEKCNGYRYPTEIEWEYAARGGDDRATYNGNLTIIDNTHAPELDTIAIYGANDEANYEGAYDCSKWPNRGNNALNCGTSKVKMKKQNNYGLYDMIGNVWEWTWDYYDRQKTNLDQTINYVNINPSAPRIIRGCGWHNFASRCRAAMRDGSSANTRINFIGLRPARSVK